MSRARKGARSNLAPYLQGDAQAAAARAVEAEAKLDALHRELESVRCGAEAAQKALQEEVSKLTVCACIRLPWQSQSQFNVAHFVPQDFKYMQSLLTGLHIILLAMQQCLELRIYSHTSATSLGCKLHHPGAQLFSLS